MTPAIGSIFPYAGEITTNSRAKLLSQCYAFCDGSQISRNQYPELLKIIKVLYGCGDGYETVNLPDYRGYFQRGVSLSSINDPDKDSRTALWHHGNEGNQVGSIQSDAFKSHNHQFGEIHDKSFKSESSGASPIKNSNSNQIFETDFSGGNETRPVNISVNYIIYLGEPKNI